MVMQPRPTKNLRSSHMLQSFGRFMSGWLGRMSPPPSAAGLLSRSTFLLPNVAIHPAPAASRAKRNRSLSP